MGGVGVKPRVRPVRPPSVPHRPNERADGATAHGEDGLRGDRGLRRRRCAAPPERARRARGERAARSRRRRSRGSGRAGRSRRIRARPAAAPGGRGDGGVGPGRREARGRWPPLHAAGHQRAREPRPPALRAARSRGGPGRRPRLLAPSGPRGRALVFNCADVVEGRRGSSGDGLVGDSFAAPRKICRSRSSVRPAEAPTSPSPLLPRRPRRRSRADDDVPARVSAPAGSRTRAAAWPAWPRRTWGRART